MRALLMWKKAETQVNYLCFTTTTANQSIKLEKIWNPTVVNLEYWVEPPNLPLVWNHYNIWSTIIVSSAWTKIYFRNTSTTDTWFSTGSLHYYYFSVTPPVVSWDVTTLLNKNWTNTLSNYCLCNLFKWCTSLTTAPELNATNLGEGCYAGMFDWCTSLTTAPVLPATHCPNECYCAMFRWCISLTTPPVLNSTSLGGWFTYANMFEWCTSLSSAPALPATNLNNRYGCYYYMFSWCTSLTTPPELPATILAQNCYRNMFSGCTSLTSLPKLPATTLASMCYYMMFNWCTQIKLSATQTWTYQTQYKIPFTWTWVDATDSMTDMFLSTWWTFTWTPTINTTYYTSNALV